MCDSSNDPIAIVLAAMKAIKRHQIPERAKISELFSTNESEIFPFFLKKYERDPNSALGESLYSLLNIFNCAICLDLSPETILADLERFKTIAVAHLRFGSGDVPFTISIADRDFQFIPEAHSEYMYVSIWADAVAACILLNDRDNLQRLTCLDAEDFDDRKYSPRNNRLEIDRFALDYFRFMRGFLTDRNNSNELLIPLLSAALEPQGEASQTEFARSICYPELRLYQIILDADKSKFDRQLAIALTAHRQYWSHESRCNDPKGWIALRLLAVSAIAVRSLGWKISIRSDYIPDYLISRSTYSNPK